MDDQITVRLPTPLGRTLRRTSRRLGRRPSDVVRMALEAFLQGAPSADGKRSRTGGAPHRLVVVGNPRLGGATS